MTANLVLRLTREGEKSESGIAQKRFESGNVLTVSFCRSGNY